MLAEYKARTTQPQSSSSVNGGRDPLWACTGAGLALLLWALGNAGPALAEAGPTSWPQYDANPFVMSLDIPTIPSQEESAGGIVVADVDGDGLLDYLVTVPGHLACYAHDGKKLWVNRHDIQIGGSSERSGLPGHHGPGVAIAYAGGSKRAEVLYLTKDGVLRGVDGVTGEEKWSARPSVPEGAVRWEHLVVANFRGRGDRDLLLQATNVEGYRMGRYVAAYSLGDLRREKPDPLWRRDDFLACAHNGARVADLDGDGKDEVLGGTIVSPQGEILYTLPVRGHIDSIFVGDVRPDLPGLEVIALEEGGGNRVFLYNHKGLIWETHHNHWEPQNAALGEFDRNRPGLEVWCRSRFDTHQKPFVFDARGELVAAYELDSVAPEGWTQKGVEVIWTVDWTGEPEQCAAAKERHESGDIAVFEPLTGMFVFRQAQKADRLFVADVSGDWREELIVLAGNELYVCHNAAPNPDLDRARLWDRPYYRKSKMTWNYYSP